MTWKIILVKNAETQINKLNESIKKKIILKLKEVEKEPFTYIDRLSGSQQCKLRIGNYRAVMEIHNEEHIISVIKIRKRSRVYD